MAGLMGQVQLSVDHVRTSNRRTGRGGQRFQFLALLLLMSSVLIVMTMATGILSSSQLDFSMMYGSASQSDLMAPPVEQIASYVPSPLEEYVMNNAKKLGYDIQSPPSKVPKGCALWRDPNATEIHGPLQVYLQELNQYAHLCQKYNGSPVKDVGEHLDNDDKKICDTLELHPDGLQGIFSSGSLSKMGTGQGYVEPMLPPMRHPRFCYEGRSYLLNLGYLVHDFAAMCRQLKPTSRTVFVDMGAALDFHPDSESPAVYITQRYKRFGIHFDHIYAFEVAKKDPEEVYKQIPEEWRAAFHWCNVGVQSDPESPYNPLKMILNTFNEDDYIVVKLDIDRALIENPLAMSILTDERYHKLIDHFYFEYHVHLAELAGDWGPGVEGSLEDSLKLFHELRQKGIASHSWP